MHEKSFINSVAEFRYHGLLFDAVLYAGKKTAEARLSSCDNVELSLMANLRLVDACKNKSIIYFQWLSPRSHWQSSKTVKMVSTYEPRHEISNNLTF